MTVPKLALKNLLGAGLRTWLNVFVLSLSFVLIIFTQGLLEGMNKQAEEAMIASEVAGGHFQHAAYDPYDPLTLVDARGPVPGPIAALAASGQAAPVLVIQGTIYPAGRLYTVLIKGIDPGQTVVNMPTSALAAPLAGDEIPVLVGERMAKTAGLERGSLFTIQWRDARGTFDARDAVVAEIMKTTVQTIDSGQIWVPLDRLREMTGLPGEATFAILAQDAPRPASAAAVPAGWVFRTQDDFLATIRAMVESKSVGSSIIYAIFLALAMLAIFDTQVLAIFHRRREMGTLMALGFTRAKVIGLFTLEGMLNGVLAACVAAVYGIPLLTWMARTGWALPGNTDSYGFAIGERLFPSYSLALVAGTTLLVLLTTTVVSFLPTRRIAKLKPTDALRGRMT
ncbi:MAG: FtsX-like permease family protein [Candidatus Aminicenantes bacterium]|nr:FtsX-like permease family protein [Candidatus Aminicenantes bacterium]